MFGTMGNFIAPQRMPQMPPRGYPSGGPGMQYRVPRMPSRMSQYGGGQAGGSVWGRLFGRQPMGMHNFQGGVGGGQAGGGMMDFLGRRLGGQAPQPSAAPIDRYGFAGPSQEQIRASLSPEQQQQVENFKSQLNIGSFNPSNVNQNALSGMLGALRGRFGSGGGWGFGNRQPNIPNPGMPTTQPMGGGYNPMAMLSTARPWDRSVRPASAPSGSYVNF